MVETETTGGTENGELPLSVQMTRLLTGFEISQALYAVAKHDIATVLLDAPMSVDQLAATTGTHPDSLRRMLRTLTGVGVVTQGYGDTFALTELGSTLARGSVGSVRDMAIMLMETHYAPFTRFAETVQTGVPAATMHYGQPFTDWVTADTERAGVFSAAMAAMTDSVQGDVFDGYRLPAGTTVADLGGADGSVLLRLLRDEPDQQGIVVDLPHVVPAARTRVVEDGMADRVEVVAADFFTTVPAADVYLLSTVLHDWDDNTCTTLLQQIAETAQPGARLVLVETVIPADDQPHFSKSADLTMLGMVTGRERSQAEFSALLDRAGFRLDRIADTPDTSPYAILEATLCTP